MKLIVDGRIIEINTLGSDIDAAFTSLYASYFGHQATNLADFEAASARFFTAHLGATFMHDAYFSNFINIWNYFLSIGKYDEAEQVWSLALTPALMWEESNPGLFIHKGTPYYFWAMTTLLRGDIDKGYALMHRAVAEDIRTDGHLSPDTPAYALVSLNYANSNQAFLQWVLEQAKYLSERLVKYSASYNRNFSLDDFKNKFLISPPSTDISFLFAYTVARLMKLSSLPKHALQSQFAAQIELNLFFDIALVIDAAIKFKNQTKWKFIDHANQLSIKAGQRLTKPFLIEINRAYQANFDNTLTDAVNGSIVLHDGTSLSRFQSDLAIAYGLRNFGAHDVSAMPTISARFAEIEQALLNILFAAVDYMY